MAKTFEANDVEQAAAETWMAAHRCVQHAAFRDLNSKVAIPHDPFVWVFQQTSVATTVTVQCSLCDAKQDMSDIASW